MEGLELVCFEIISNAYSAKSNFTEALQLVKSLKYEEAEQLMEAGHRYLSDAHRTHLQLLSKEASQKKIKLSLLLIHVEDQLSSAETIELMVIELMASHKEIQALKQWRQELAK